MSQTTASAPPSRQLEKAAGRIHIEEKEEVFKPLLLLRLSDCKIRVLDWYL